VGALRGEVTRLEGALGTLRAAGEEHEGALQAANAAAEEARREVARLSEEHAKAHARIDALQVISRGGAGACISLKCL
jgi:chromosome segregation ATPase